MSRHAGEVAFPGGLLEPGESPEQAALRETREEVGIDASRIDIVGRLDDAWSGARNHLVAWATGGHPDRGPARLAEQTSFFGEA